jgi:ferredoxin-2, mitochondrial
MIRVYSGARLQRAIKCMSRHELRNQPWRSSSSCLPAAVSSQVSSSLHRGDTSTAGTGGASSSLLGGIRWHGGPSVAEDAPTVTLTFLQPDDTKKQVSARVGESLLQTAHRNDIDLEGACEGVCACSTCHLIFSKELYDTLPDPSEDEEDMLDMAFGLTETSRLGCQVIVTSEMDGTLLEMPKATRNFYVDGHVPKPH